jgi:thiamine-phosphate pyrophosphorylase
MGSKYNPHGLVKAQTLHLYFHLTMNIPFSFGFYAVLTDPVRGYEYCTKMCVDHEILFVQLRMKDAPEKEIVTTAEAMRKITSGTKTKLIINDSPHIAELVHADGVHVGQGDMPYADARKIVGKNAIIGISTHSAASMKAACALEPDYVGMGPVFATATKKDADPVIGLEGLKDMLAIATVPVVAIGGITLENLPDVYAAGVRNFCMMQSLMQATDPGKVLREILKRYKGCLQETP